MVSGSLYGSGDTIVLKRCHFWGSFTKGAGGGLVHVLYGIINEHNCKGCLHDDISY